MTKNVIDLGIIERILGLEMKDHFMEGYCWKKEVNKEVIEVEFGAICVWGRQQTERQWCSSDEIYGKVLCAGIAGRFQLELP